MKFWEEVALLTMPTYQSHPGEDGVHMAAQEFCQMWESKMSKLKGGYTLSARLLFSDLAEGHTYPCPG